MSLAVAISLAACSQPPYKAEDGEADLIKAGFSQEQARCVISDLDAYFREEFLAGQEAEGITNVSKQQVDTYVKNRFAGTGDIASDLAAKAASSIEDCR